MTVHRQAACSCGQLSIDLHGDPLLVSSCHCLACQRRTGALFGSTSFWNKSQLAADRGARQHYRRQGDSGTWLTFSFCPTCGSTVFWQSEKTPELLSVAVGAFADPHFPPPRRTVWTESRHPWLAFPPHLPHHEKSPPED